MNATTQYYQILTIYAGYILTMPVVPVPVGRIVVMN